MLKLFGFDDLTAAVVTAVGANTVRQVLFTAVRAGDERSRFQAIMGAPAIAASLGNFPLWQWSH
jgi:hypothetical protein